MQRQRYRLFRRKNGTYYSFENDTGRQTSLFTKDRGEATGLLAAKNQATAQPSLNVAMAKVYLSAKSPELLTRTWGELIEVMMRGYTGATAVRWGKFRRSAPLRMLENLPIYQTEASHFLAILEHKKAGVSTNVWLRILHNRALDLGWLLAPVMPKRAWPKVQYGSRRAITAEEHEKILAAERLPDYALYFKLLWETGGSQSDVVNLRAEDVDWSTRRLHYSRQKLATRGGGQASLAIGARLEALLKRLPFAGPCFRACVFWVRTCGRVIFAKFANERALSGYHLIPTVTLGLREPIRLECRNSRHRPISAMGVRQSTGLMQEKRMCLRCLLRITKPRKVKSCWFSVESKLSMEPISVLTALQENGIRYIRWRGRIFKHQSSICSVSLLRFRAGCSSPA